MKYLKKFEAHGWNKFIKKLNNQELKLRVKNKKFVDFTEKEEYSIINLLKPLIKTGKIISTFNIRMTKDGQKMSRVSYNGDKDILFYKSDRDEWYYGIFGTGIYDPNIISDFHPFSLSDNKLVTYRFECDQFDGLLRMMSEFMESIERIEDKKTPSQISLDGIKDKQSGPKNESLFNQRMGDKLWVEFDSTHEPFETSTGDFVGSWQFNGMKDFRNHHKKITPKQDTIENVINLVKSKISGLFDVKYYPEWRQIYCRMHNDEKQYSYAESEKLNKNKFIISFYDEDWIFVALCKKGVLPVEKETHFVCDDIVGLEQWLDDHKKDIEKIKTN